MTPTPLPTGNGTSAPVSVRNTPYYRDEPEPTPFPVECLPEAARDMAQAIAHTVSVPESLSGACVLGILSASIGAGLQLRTGSERVTRGNLFILASAESGTGKSESFRLAARPLFEVEHKTIDAWEAHTLPRLMADIELLESEIKSLLKRVGRKDSAIDREASRREIQAKKIALAELQKQRHAPVLTCEDITVEKLADLLAKRGEVLASLSPDAGNIVNNLLGRYHATDRTDEGLYLKAYSGDYTRVDRIGREPVTLHHPCLSALWLTQPDKLDSLLTERSLTDGGLIPRLLICHTNCQPTHITGNQQGIPSATLQGWGELVEELLTAYCHTSETLTIDPSPAAVRLFTDHHNLIVDRRLSDLQDITSYAARWTEQAMRLSVVLHAAQHGASAREHCLSPDTAADAITLADWFSSQQLDILSAGRWQTQRHQQREVLTLLATIPEGITARNVQRARIAKDADAAHALLDAMEAQGQLTGKDVTPDHGGKTSRIYTRRIQ
jgi:hypothetical protein